MTKTIWLSASVAFGALTLAAFPDDAMAQVQGESEDPQPVADTPVSGSLEPRDENGRKIYDAMQFGRFNPRTALDMVRQVPGFTIDRGNEGERGLGQADANVIINNARIPGKNVDVRTSLGRISAENVVRIEIVEGTSLSISGLSGQVLNLVTKVENNRGLTGNFKWRPQVRRAGINWFAGEISVNTKLGKGDLTLSLENDAGRASAAGPEQITDRFGNLLFERFDRASFRNQRPILSAAYNRTSEAGSIFNLNGSFGLNRFRERVETVRTRAGQPDIFELFAGQENEWNAEVSADYEFDFGGGRLKFIGLQRLEHSPFENFFGLTFTDGVTAPTGDQFDQTIDEGESVVRAEFNWKTDGGTDLGVSVEGAYNFLDSEGVFSSFANPGVLTPLGNSKVTEYRGELIGSYGRPLTDNLTLQATLGGEYSQISQTGDRSQTRSFIRPKGSVSLAWKPETDLDVSLKLERKVGQLNFFDFIASVEVANDTLNAGNPDLVPPQTWRAELEATQKLGPWGSMTVNIYGEKISDIVDSIPITPTTEALGNLPKATRYGVDFISSILFDPIGWKGAKLDIEADVRKSTVQDPLTGIFRNTNREKVFRYEVSLRHDIPNSDWAWGGGVEQFQGSGFLRLDEARRFSNNVPYTWLFVEHKNILGMTAQINVGNFLAQQENFKRTVFVDRRDGPIDFIEDRSRKYGVIYRLTLSGSF